MERIGSHNYDGNLKPRVYGTVNVSDNQRKVLQQISEQTEVPIGTLQKISIHEIEEICYLRFHKKEEEIVKSKMKIRDLYMRVFPWFIGEVRAQALAEVFFSMRKYKIKE